MSKRVNRRTWFLAILSFVLLVAIVIFSVFFLIPKGKEYRTMRLESKKEEQLIHAAQMRYEQVNEKAQRLKHDNAGTIKAYHTPFDPAGFTKKYKEEFNDLFLTELEMIDQNGTFKVYEVNATTKISSPQTFYRFLEQINQSDWIIGVDFPVYFEREGEWIKSSFTMKVHNDGLDEKIEREKKGH